MVRDKKVTLSLNKMTVTQNQIMAEALQLHRAGKLYEAREKYQLVLQIAPSNQSAMHNLGMVLMGMGNLKSGLDLIEKVLEKNSSFPEVGSTYKEVSMMLYRAHFWETARPWLEKAIECSPGDSQLHEVYERTSPRRYLEPEIFDPLAGETLQRYSPRESSHYIYVIDIMGTCNLRCPTCPVGNFQRASRPRGKMQLRLFEKIVAKIADEKPDKETEIYLFNWGEPFLHPELPEFIKRVHNYSLRCQLSTNLNIEKGVEEVIKANPDVVKISLSGYSAQTYTTSHKGGDIHLVKSNLYGLRYYLNKHKATTHVWVGHHIYKHTHQERRQVQQMCEELGFQYQAIQAFYQPLEKLLALVDNDPTLHDEPILDNLLVHPARNIEHIQKYRRKGYDCELRFNQTVINYDGSVALCCGVYDEPNMLGIQFLDTPFSEIERRKYMHPFCQQCRTVGLDYSITDLSDTQHTQTTT